MAQKENNLMMKKAVKKCFDDAKRAIEECGDLTTIDEETKDSLRNAGIFLIRMAQIVESTYPNFYRQRFYHRYVKLLEKIESLKKRFKLC